jgi:formylmethanofuran dehydrogenase subunit D
MKYIYNTEDIFEDIPGDPDNVIMKFPEELLKEVGWKEGDTLDIKIEDGSVTVTKVNG